MAGLGILLAGLSAGGKGLGSSLMEEQKTNDEQRLMAERSRLDEEKQLRIDEARRVATRQAGILQGQEIDAGTTALQNQRNQADADRINAQNADVIGGSNMSAADVAGLRNAPEEARKAYGILTSDRQSQLEDRATAAEKLGYLDAAKETRSQLQTEFQNQRNQINDANANRRLDIAEARQNSLDTYNQRREDRLDRLAAAQLSFQQSRASKEDARAEQFAMREERAATTAALRGAEADIKSMQKDLADPLMPEAQKQVVQQQLEGVRKEAQRYRQALGGAGIEIPAQTSNKTGWDSSSGDVYKNGQKIGTAKSETEARQLVFGQPQKQGGTTVPNPVAPDQTKVQEPAKPAPRTTAQIRGRIETREQPIARGKTKTQYKNPTTGEWVDTREEAAKGL